MTKHIPAEDRLKFIVARLHSVTDWAIDSIGGSGCEPADGHETELDAIADLVAEITHLASGFGDPLVYSDGRAVKSRKQIQASLIVEHVWHPDPALEEPRSSGSSLPSDPGVPSPGVYEVTTNPGTQEIDVRVIRLEPDPT